MSRLLDLLYPPVCPGCGELPTGDGPLCERCRIGLEGLRSDGSFEELQAAAAAYSIEDAAARHGG